MQRSNITLSTGLRWRPAWFVLLVLGTTLAAQEPPPAAPRSKPPAKTPDAATFQVVINDANPTTEMAASRVAKMFLKKDKRWDHGVDVMPVDRDPRSPIREAFTKSVHRKSVTAVQSLWQRYIFAGRAVPPDQKSSDEDVLTYVRSKPGAIGYVAAETSLGDGVKQLKVTQ